MASVPRYRELARRPGSSTSARLWPTVGDGERCRLPDYGVSEVGAAGTVTQQSAMKRSTTQEQTSTRLPTPTGQIRPAKRTVEVGITMPVTTEGLLCWRPLVWLR